MAFLLWYLSRQVPVLIRPWFLHLFLLQLIIHNDILILIWCPVISLLQLKSGLCVLRTAVWFQSKWQPLICYMVYIYFMVYNSFSVIKISSGTSINRVCEACMLCPWEVFMWVVISFSGQRPMGVRMLNLKEGKCGLLLRWWRYWCKRTAH